MFQYSVPSISRFLSQLPLISHIFSSFSVISPLKSSSFPTALEKKPFFFAGPNNKFATKPFCWSFIYISLSQFTVLEPIIIPPARNLGYVYETFCPLLNSIFTNP